MTATANRDSQPLIAEWLQQIIGVGADLLAKNFPQAPVSIRRILGLVAIGRSSLIACSI
jgi:hypothetical protein